MYLYKFWMDYVFILYLNSLKKTLAGSEGQVSYRSGMFISCRHESLSIMDGLRQNNM